MPHHATPAHRNRAERLLRTSYWLLAGLLLSLTAGAARAADPAAPLRVCMDPDNPPFSSTKAEAPGLYAELGQHIADQPTSAGAVPAAGEAAAGEKIFNDTCSHCHGPDAVQAEHHIDLRRLRLRYGDRMDEVFTYTVHHGRPDKGMPNWSGILSEDDFAKIKAFLHTVQTPSS